MIRICLFIGLFSFCIGNAQTLFVASNSMDSTNSVVINGYANAFYQGQGLSNEFMNKLIFGGYIDDQLKDQTEQKLLNFGNRLAFGFSTGIKCYVATDRLLNNPNWNFAVNADYIELNSSTYSKDLFHIIFSGNADRIGQNMELGPSYINRIVFQKLGLNLAHKSNNCEFGVSFVKGQSHFALAANQMTLHTESDLSAISLETNTYMQSANKQGNKIGAFNGAGFALNFTYSLPIKVKNHQSSSLSKENVATKEIGTITLQMDNIGAVAWNNSPSTYQIDTTYSYAGYEVDNLFNIDNVNWVDENTISDSILPQPRVSNYWTVLPAVFNLVYVSKLTTSHPLGSVAGARYQLNADMKPMVYGGVNIRLHRKLSTSVIGIVGGYGTITTGIRINYSSNLIRAFASCNNVIGLISKKGYGKNINLGLQCRF
ncbi:MAG: hypothetical protein HOL28_00530 [Crocinitomicaceae bacterium]|nr:hypothetical protein [Crocinitomicaceae bacterium]